MPSIFFQKIPISHFWHVYVHSGPVTSFTYTRNPLGGGIGFKLRSAVLYIVSYIWNVLPYAHLQLHACTQ